MSSPEVLAENVTTRNEFIQFVRALVEDRESDPTRWEAQSIEHYLEALAAWVNDMDGWFKNRGEQMPDPSWWLFAQILIAARVYE